MGKREVRRRGPSKDEDDLRTTEIEPLSYEIDPRPLERTGIQDVRGDLSGTRSVSWFRSHFVLCEDHVF